MRQVFSAPIFGVLLWIVFASTGRAQDGGTWEMRAPMPVRRQEVATEALNGRVYVLGGYDENRRSTATVEVYNPTTDTWAFAHSLPFTVNHSAAAVAGGFSTVSVPEQVKHLFTMRTATRGPREPPATMCMVERR